MPSVVQTELQHCSQVLGLKCMMVDDDVNAGRAGHSVTSQVQSMHLHRLFVQHGNTRDDVPGRRPGS